MISFGSSIIASLLEEFNYIQFWPFTLQIVNFEILTSIQLIFILLLIIPPLFTRHFPAVLLFNFFKTYRSYNSGTHIFHYCCYQFFEHLISFWFYYFSAMFVDIGANHSIIDRVKLSYIYDDIDSFEVGYVMGTSVFFKWNQKKWLLIYQKILLSKIIHISLSWIQISLWLYAYLLNILLSFRILSF